MPEYNWKFHALPMEMYTGTLYIWEKSSAVFTKAECMYDPEILL